MSFIHSRLAGRLLPALLALAAFSTRVEAQALSPAPGPTLDAMRVGLNMPATLTRSSPCTEGAALNRVENVVFGAAAGALAGWLVFSIGVGALSSDHGTPYKRERRRWVIGGAAFGALLGAFPPPPPPRRA